MTEPIRITARLLGESIAGDEIFYQCGKVRARASHRRVDLTLDQNVDAYCVQRLRLTLQGGKPPSAFTKLEARKADSSADSHAADRAKSHSGGHTNFTGTLRGGAVVNVRIPRPGRVG